MKLRIEIEENLVEDEVIIHCGKLSEQIGAIQAAVSNVIHAKQKMICYRQDTEFYLLMDDILFFETEENGISVHTREDIFQTRYKLYELEDMLPGFFMRVSKSTILNTNHVYSIDRNLTASSLVSFQGTHKQVYVSRNYYKPLRNKLEEKRLQK